MTFRRALFHIIAFLFAFCFVMQGSRAAGPAANNARRAVIFIPGFMGSKLREKETKRIVYVSVGSVLSGGKSLALFQSELKTQAGPELEPDGVLDFVRVVPLVYKIDVYGGLLDRLRQIPETVVFPFPYDWRDDPIKAVIKLSETIEEIQKQGYTDISIVAHSGGGWIATYYLGYGQQDPSTAILDWRGAHNISRVTLLGIPFGGSFQFIKYLARGNDIPFMKSMFSAETMATFPFSYRAIQRAATMVDQSGNSVAVNFGDVNTWKRFSIGLFSGGATNSNTVNNRELFSFSQLAQALTFMNRINFAGESAQPPSLQILNIVGAGIKTLNSAYLIPKQDHSVGLLFDTDLSGSGLKADPLFADGDGIVTATASAIPEILKSITHTQQFKVGHDQLPVDKEIRQKIVDFLTASPSKNFR